MILITTLVFYVTMCQALSFLGLLHSHVPHVSHWEKERDTAGAFNISSTKISITEHNNQKTLFGIECMEVVAILRNAIPLTAKCFQYIFWFSKQALRML